MFIEIGSRLKILDPSPELIKWCKENLEMTNPEYQHMYHSRQNHKLDEWREFCKWVETLPYSQLITG